MNALSGRTLFTALALAITAQAASASVIISEVDPSGSGTSAYAADWFELTNTGSAAVSLAGWKMDDNSNSFSSAVALRGVASLAAGQSAVFIEGNTSGSNDATLAAAFKSAWFGSNAPAGLLVGGYGGSGVGLSTSADAVNIFNAAGTLITRVDFASASAARTFDNTAGPNNVTLTQLSAVGVNSAFASAASGEIGSPGVSPVPEPGNYALMLAGLGSLGLLMAVARKKQG